MCCSLRITPKLCTGTELTLELKLKRAKEGKKSIQPQALNHRSPDVYLGPHSVLHQEEWFFFVKPKVFILFRLYSEPALKVCKQCVLQP